MNFLQNKLISNDLDGFIVADTHNLSYLLKEALEGGVLLVTREKVRLYLSPIYEQFRHDTIEIVYSREIDFKQFFHRAKRIGFSATATAYATVRDWEKEGLALEHSDLIEKMREIKDEEEIAYLKEALRIVLECYEFLKGAVAVNMTELTLAGLFHQKLRELGASDAAFSPIIAFGPNTSSPHHRASERRLKKNEPILVDIGVKYKGYCSDITRVFCLGKMPSEVEVLYEIAKEAHNQAFKLCRPGTLFSDIDKAAKGVLERAGYKERFIHGLGHGIGLAVHEEPKFSTKGARLEKGMVFTLEPGIYLPHLYGVRYENMIV
jgi:Xaa-Pro aminopeptidase